jgi:NarL family two-component system response regulator LiaR
MPGRKLIFLTMNQDPDLTIEALSAGPSGYLMKSSTASELSQAIQETLRGKFYVTPKIACRAAEAFGRGPETVPDDALTPRELRVLQ